MSPQVKNVRGCKGWGEESNTVANNAYFVIISKAFFITLDTTNFFTTFKCTSDLISRIYEE